MHEKHPGAPFIPPFPGVDVREAMDRKSGAVMLTLTDYLGWENSSAHQQLLPCKLNNYLAFGEGGQC
jgi:hypothetical protein